VESVARLANDPALRRRMGRSGRRRVESAYSVTAGAARWLNVLEGIDRRMAWTG
jgi:glycosyltransferase involved in cell wall biosynthesis